jgi:hypothetical protein
MYTHTLAGTGRKIYLKLPGRDIKKVLFHFPPSTLFELLPVLIHTQRSRNILIIRHVVYNPEFVNISKRKGG